MLVERLKATRDTGNSNRIHHNMNLHSSCFHHSSPDGTFQKRGIRPQESIILYNNPAEPIKL